MKLKLLMRSKPVSRVADAPAPGLWVGTWRRVMGPSTEVIETPLGDEVDQQSPLYLVAAWKPLAPGQFVLRRYPALARLVAADGDGDPVVRALLRLVPADARLCFPEMEVDWGLIAEIALASEPDPSPERLKLLQLVMRRDRERRFDQIRRRFRQTAGTAGSSGASGGERPPFANTRGAEE